MRGFLNEIKNVAVNRATNRIKNLIADAIGGTNGLPMNSGSILPSSANRFGRVNPYEGEMVTYPEDLGSEDQGHMVLFNINEQENANVNFGGGDRIRNATDNIDPGLMRAMGTPSGSVPPNQYYDQLKGKSTAHVKRAPTRRLSSSIAMYMPASVSVGTSAQYSEVEIGSLAVAAQNLLNQSDTPNPFDNPAEFGAKMVKKAKESYEQAKATGAAESFKEGFVRGILDPIPGLSGIGAVEDIGRGFVRNDRLELSFNGIGRRSFSFSFKCMPKSENEALAVDKIVNMFRFYMAPSFKGDVSASRTMIVPATFDISYLFETGTPNFFLNRISTCVLESCNVTYGGERVQFYRPTTKLVNGKTMPGAPPVETSIELQFKEIELITRERIGVGY